MLAEQSRNPFQKFDAELKKIIADPKIKLNIYELFVEFILTHVNIPEKFNRYFVEPDRPGEFCLVHLGISASNLKKLVNFYLKIPELKVEDVTKMNPPTLSIDGLPLLIIRMSAAALEKHLLPKFKDYLATHPELINDRHYEFKEMQTEIARMFEPEGVDSNKCTVFVDTLCAVAVDPRRNHEVTKQLNNCTPLPTVLFTLIKDYLNLIEFKSDTAPLQPIKSDLSESVIPFAADVDASVSLAEAQILIKYLSNLDLRSTILYPMDVIWADENGGPIFGNRIRVKNRALMHSGLFSDIRDAYKRLPLSKQNHYLEANGKVKFPNTAIKLLEEALQELEPFSSYKLLSGALYKLIDLMKPTRIIDMDRLYQVSNCIKELEKELKEFMSNEKSKAHQLNLKLFMASTSPAQFNKFVDKIENALKKLNAVIESRNQKIRVVQAGL